MESLNVTIEHETNELELFKDLPWTIHIVFLELIIENTSSLRTRDFCYSPITLWSIWDEEKIN